jgi:hypothetical protein
VAGHPSPLTCAPWAGRAQKATNFCSPHSRAVPPPPPEPVRPPPSLRMCIFHIRVAKALVGG